MEILVILSRVINTSQFFIIFVETSDGHILLTRRASHMRTFPNIWVPPGGSIDWNEESLFAAGLRELEEETNLKFAEEDVVSCKPLCMWESVYPTMSSKGKKSEISLLFYCIYMR
jgi:8-oxo-dGTP pyrophosphatase MutT (NUDIX family)